MQADADKQIEAILKTIGAFMNTSGGHLYLGGNDTGELLTPTKFNHFLCCDVIPQAYIADQLTICNNGNKVGHNLTTDNLGKVVLRKLNDRGFTH